MLNIFGLKAVIFAAENLHSPNIDTVRLWKTKNTTVFDFSDQQMSIKFISKIYKEMKENNNDLMPIPFMLIEDETAIDPRIEYDAA